MVENSLQMNSESYAKKSGIKREFSTPYNPQQNGVAEWNFKIFEGKNINWKMTLRK